MASATTLSTMGREAREVVGGPLWEGGVRLAHDDNEHRVLQPNIGVRTGAVESNQLLAQLLNRLLQPLLEVGATRLELLEPQ